MPTLERQNLFVQAEDWTDVDSDGDGIPDWWIWMYFGNLNETATNLDSGGNTIGDDYQFYLMSGCFPDVPNVISFTWSCTNQNQCVSTSIVAQVNVTGGMPSFFFAVVLDSTNFAGAAWTAYTSSNILINLGTTPGWHDVWIGLRGWPPNAQPTWQKKHLYLALPPVLVITNPVNATGSTFTRPWLQLQGCGNEPLLAVEYDVTNAAGMFTNQQGFVTDQVFDTNQFDFTTNWFQCYDVPLTNGLNLITLRVADRAGNVTVTNVAITLDYSLATNPPVMNIIWPQDGMAVSGPNFYVRGRLNDETATVTAQVVDAGGNTNAAEGIVERNGMFWVENLPLTNGDNIVTVTATDAAGNVTTTNLTVSESDVGLTIDSTPSGNGLYQPSGTVGGSISDPSYAVWVNGVEANTNYWYDDLNEVWRWQAANVPVHGRGTMTFDAVAYPAEQEMAANFSARGMQAMNNSASTAANASAAVEARPYWAVTDYHDNKTTRSLDSDPQNGVLYSATWGKNYRARYQPDANGQWVATYQGTMTDHFEYSDHYGSEWIETDYAWSDSGDSMHSTDSYGNDEFWPYLDDAAEVDRVTYVPDEDLTAFGQEGRNPPMFISHYRAAGVAWHWDFPYPRTLDTTVGAATKVTLYTGGKAKMGRQNLFCIHCGATQYGRPADYPSFNAPWLDTPGTNMDVTSLTVMGKHPGSDGNVWIALPDNSEPDMTVTAPADHYSAGASPQKCTLEAPSLAPDQGLLVTTNPVNTYLVSYCEGSYVTVVGTPCCSTDPRALAVYWSMSGGLPYPSQDETTSLTHRLVDRSQIGATTITATAGGLSTSIKVIVCQAKVEIDADKGDCGFDVGHAWWNLSIEPPEAAALLPHDLQGDQGLAGYYDHCQPVGGGQVIFGEQIEQCSGNNIPHNTTGSYWWCVSLNSYIGALIYVNQLSEWPGIYNVSGNNCVTQAIQVCGTGGATLTGYNGIDPCSLSRYLNGLIQSINPGPPQCYCVQ